MPRVAVANVRTSLYSQMCTELKHRLVEHLDTQGRAWVLPGHRSVNPEGKKDESYPSRVQTYCPLSEANMMSRRGKVVSRSNQIVAGSRFLAIKSGMSISYSRNTNPVSDKSEAHSGRSTCIA